MPKKIFIALYIMKQKIENILDEKHAKIMKQSHACKGYANTYSVEILNSFDRELQIKDTESGIKNKLIDLLSELRRFKFVKTLVLGFKNVENDNKTIYNTFYSNPKAETKVTLMMHLNQSKYYYIKYTKISRKRFSLDY